MIILIAKHGGSYIIKWFKRVHAAYATQLSSLDYNKKSASGCKDLHNDKNNLFTVDHKRKCYR